MIRIISICLLVLASQLTISCSHYSSEFSCKTPQGTPCTSMKKIVYEVRKEMALTYSKLDEQQWENTASTEEEETPKEVSLGEVLLAPHIADFKSYRQILIKLDL